MRIILTLTMILTMCFTQISFGQDELKIEKIDNSQLIKILNNSQLIEASKDNFLSVKLFIIDNGTGSAGFPNSEVSYNLLIAVSEIDEKPDQNLFEIGPFYNPKIVEWTSEDEKEIEIEIEYGIYKNRKTVKLKININELEIKK